MRGGASPKVLPPHERACPEMGGGVEGGIDACTAATASVFANIALLTLPRQTKLLSTKIISRPAAGEDEDVVITVVEAREQEEGAERPAGENGRWRSGNGRRDGGGGSGSGGSDGGGSGNGSSSGSDSSS